MSAYPPSNGTMGAMWSDAWCYRCVNDHGFSHGDGPEWGDPDKGCPLIVQMMVEKGPFDFLREEEYEGGWDPHKLECVNFERCPCHDDPGWEPPEPVPFDPNQGLLFDVLPDSPVTPGGMWLPVDAPAPVAT